MLERTDAITNEALEPITFVLAYPTVLKKRLTDLCFATDAKVKQAVTSLIKLLDADFLYARM